MCGQVLCKDIVNIFAQEMSRILSMALVPEYELGNIPGFWSCLYFDPCLYSEVTFQVS